MNIVFGALGILLAMFLVLIFGGVATAVVADNDPDAYTALPFIGISGALLSLFAVPFGTMFGAYALWVLFSKDTEKLFAPPAVMTS